MFNKSIISNESDYRSALAAIEPLLQKGFSHLTIEEDEELAHITSLRETF
jgi:antitoxin component HigA of HigAB toxin-antitoxin module